MNFQKIIGHEPQKKSLISCVENNHIAHAYLFSGPEGIGKKLIATEFAKLINCKDRQNDNFSKDCNCISCSKIDKGVNPDVHIFEYQDVKTIKVNQIREDIEKVVYLSPYESEFKIFIIDNAERMNFNAQNAFLKTLEEPPKNSVIILISSLSDLIIPTVKSRCQIINFNKLETKEIESFLEANSDHNSEEIKLISRISDGSIGKALNIDDDFLKLRNEYIKKLLEVNVNRPTTIFDFAEKVSKLSKTNDLSELKRFFDILSIWLSDSVATSIGLDKSHIINSDMLAEINSYIENKETDNLIKKFSALENSWSNIVIYNANKQITLENLLLTLAE